VAVDFLGDYSFNIYAISFIALASMENGAKAGLSFLEFLKEKQPAW
jgi:hypothetical protein